MWKAILFRRTLKRANDDAKDKGQPPKAGPNSGAAQHPFADLMAKLDRIPYQRTRRWKSACDH